MGWTHKEIVEKNVDVFAECYPDPDYRKRVAAFVARSNAHWEDFKTKTRDGRIIDTSWTRLQLSDGTSIGIGKDITQQKRAEQLGASYAALALGERYLSPEISKHAVANQYSGASVSSQLVELTPRQREVLKMIAKGHSTKDIARTLEISAKTVETHRAQLMERLQIFDVAGLVRFAIRTGLIKIDD